MKVHPYRDILDFNQFRCSKQRKHFSGAGNVRCILDYYHKGYCRWPDHFDWTPSLDDVVRFSYPHRLKNRTRYYSDYFGKEGYITFLTDYEIDVCFDDYFEASFAFDELELISNKYMKG